jgi:hypothetical protein
MRRDGSNEGVCPTSAPLDRSTSDVLQSATSSV